MVPVEAAHHRFGVIARVPDLVVLAASEQDRATDALDLEESRRVVGWVPGTAGVGQRPAVKSPRGSGAAGNEQTAASLGTMPITPWTSPG